MNEDLKVWNDIAEDWVTEVFPKREFARLLGQQAMEKLANPSGKKILDAGCGNGWLANHFKKLGATVIGVDGSPKMIEQAKKEFPDIDFRTADLLQPLRFTNNSFDTVVSNCVLMSLERIDAYLAETFRILTVNGSLVVGVFHPCFNFPTMRLYKNWIDKLLFRKPSGLAYNYFSNQPYRREHGVGLPTKFYHRTLTQYFNEFNKAGFFVDEILEPHDLPAEYLKDHPEHEYVTRLPRGIYFKLAKRT